MNDHVPKQSTTGSAFGGTVFLEQSAHVAILDDSGRIITVNAAWRRFGHDNGLDPAYDFAAANYLEIARRAAEEGGIGSEGAAEAFRGLRDVLAGAASRFSITYPCHAPQEQRWFLMYVRPLQRGVAGAVVSHIDVTALKLAGLVPDETQRPE